MDEREQTIKQKFDLLAGELNERTRRLVAASETMTMGWGGVSLVSRATGLSRKAISQGIKELPELPEQTAESKRRIRRSGGGRKKTVSKDQSLGSDLERLVMKIPQMDRLRQRRSPSQTKGSGNDRSTPSNGESISCKADVHRS